MTYEVSISFKPLLAEVEAQTSVDFQGLRTTNAGADAVYDDFTMCEDNAPEALAQIAVAAAMLSSQFASNIRKEKWSQEDVCYVIEISNRHADCCRIKVFVNEFFKYSVLGWWYSSRNAALSEQYIEAASGALETLSAMVLTRMCERRLRWF